jgi:transmembrane sensor
MSGRDLQPVFVPAPWQPDPAHEAAASWVLQQERGGLNEAEQLLLEAWLAQDASHAAAYDDALWALGVTARHAGAPELLAMRQSALAARGNRRRLLGWAGGLGAAAAGLIALLTFTASPEIKVMPDARVPSVASGGDSAGGRGYRTAVGERSAISLPDGSVATLDTDSQMRVAYSHEERAVHLLKGQALFQVAHGKPLPFRVYARGQQITAIGTVFNVRLEDERVRVAIVEGVVKVSARPMLGGDRRSLLKEVTLTAGEETVAAPAIAMVVRPVEARAVAAWRGGQLIFNDVPLADAVAEVNRYTLRPIALADAAIGRYRVSGVFKSTEPEAFGRAMTEVLPVEMRQANSGELILRPRGD